MYFLRCILFCYSLPTGKVSVKNVTLVNVLYKVLHSHNLIIQYVFAFPVIFRSNSNCQIIFYIIALKCTHINVCVCGIRLPAPKSILLVRSSVHY